MSYVLTSPSGLIFGFWFFLLLSAAIAFMIFALLAWPSARRAELRLGVIRKSGALPLAIRMWIVIFSAIYFSALAGFHTVTVGNDDIRLEYAIPRVSVSMRYAEIGDVVRRPAYKSRWRLEIYTPTGNKFESAPGSYREIKAAAEDLELRRKRAV